MRILWHPALIPLMPDKTLLKLLQYVQAMREGWRDRVGSSIKIVPCVWYGSYEQLIAYWSLVACEVDKRGLERSPVWDDIEYRGLHEPFRCLRLDWLEMYFSTDNPYAGFHTEEKLYSQILWLRNHGKDCSKILNALRLKGFKSVEKLF